MNGFELFDHLLVRNKSMRKKRLLFIFISISNSKTLRRYVVSRLTDLHRVEGTIDVDGRLLSGGGSLFRELDHGVGETLEFSNVCAALSNDAPHLRGWGENLHRQANVHAASKALFSELLVDQVLGLKKQIRLSLYFYFELAKNVNLKGTSSKLF
jgi:hypothetical protein